MARQTYVARVEEPGQEPRFMRYLSGDRLGEVKTWTYRGGAMVEAERSYNKVSKLAVVTILPTPEEFLK